MGGLSLGALKANGHDAIGQEVRCMYAANIPHFAVYRTSLRVMIQFADDDAEAERQRTSIVALAPLRGQIAGLIDGWHDSEREMDTKFAARLDRRVADALVVGLEEDVSAAAALLVEIREEIIAIRRSRAREAYIRTATIALAAGLLGLGLVALTFRHSAMPSAIFNGIGGGMMGSFFSIAIGLRNRSILLDFQNRDNAVDALLRMAVGTIGAMLIICLNRIGIVTNVSFGSGTVGDGAEWMWAFVLGFLAGFSERLIPDLLAKAALTQAPVAANPPAGDVAAGVGLAAKSSATTGTTKPGPARAAAQTVPAT